MSVIKFRDDDTGESSMDVVEVPEGLSFQVGLVSVPTDVDCLPYVSLTMGPEQEHKLLGFLLGRSPTARQRT